MLECFRRIVDDVLHSCAYWCVVYAHLQHLLVSQRVGGKIRGLLCRACNPALGFLRDDENAAMAAAAYLRRTKTS